MWLQNFWGVGLDPSDVGGEALVMWWTLYDWAIWIAYAPLMGIFLAVISYGRTIREFMVINWIMPSVFGLLWFGVWGSTAIYWQQNGELDLVGTITKSGAVSGLWAFYSICLLDGVHTDCHDHLDPVLSTAADSMTRTCQPVYQRHEYMKNRQDGKNSYGSFYGSHCLFYVAFAGRFRG